MAKLFKSWSYDYDEEKEEFAILIQDYDGNWRAIAKVGDCPQGDLTDEELGIQYNDLLTEVIDEQGWESVWTHGQLTRIVKELDGQWHDENDICEQFWEDEDEEGIFLDRHNFRYKVVSEDEFGDWYIIEEED